MSVKRHELRYAHTEGHTDVCYTEDGKQMITCGSDGDIRVWSGIEDNDPESFCVGKGAFSVAQKANSIYICSDDGRVLILKYPEGDRDGVLTRFTALATHVTIAKNNSLIACGSEDFTVKIFDAPTDVDCTSFNMQGPLLSLAISPDEAYVAASSGDTKIYVWSTVDKVLVKTIDGAPACNSFTSAKALCRINFDPKSKYLAYPKDNEIILISVPQFVKLYTLSTEKVQVAYSICQFSPCGNFIAASSIHGDICIWRTLPGSEPVISSHNDKFNVCALAWNPEVGINEIAFCDNNGQIGALEYTPSDDSSIPVEMQTDEQLTALDFDDDDDADNENAVSLEQLKNDTLGIHPASDADSYGLNSRPQSPERPTSPPCTLQAPFQPSSTPSHLNQRFLAFNNIGMIRLHEEEDAESSIDVHFHDASVHKNLYMKNHLNHTMASLSKSVIALACETPSKLVCIPLTPGTKEWSTDLSDLEEILCICTSTKLVAMSTNIRMLRVFTVFGSQRAVLSIPGPVVSMAALNNFIFVIYHACTAHSKDQNLSGMLVQVDGGNVNSKMVPLPITPQSSLSWIGFTDAGSLASYDSAGILRICRIHSGAWIPACDTTIHAKGASDSYFLTHVCESTQTLRVIHCKGKVYPHATPTPILLELPMQVPMCEMETDKSQLEDNFFRFSHFDTDHPDKLYKETAIKLFALALRSGMDDRAYELVELLNSVQLSNVAMKYANKMGRNRLVERISAFLRRIEGEDEDVVVDENINPIKNMRPVIKRKPRIEPPEPSKQSEPVTESLPFSPVTEILTNDSIFNKDSQKEPESTPKPRVRNPFVKVPSTGPPKPNPLSLLDPAPYRPEPETPETSTPTESDFTTWYQSMKPELSKEFPELGKAALIRHALQLYKKRKAPEDDQVTQPKAKQSKLSAFAFTK